MAHRSVVLVLLGVAGASCGGRAIGPSDGPRPDVRPRGERPNDRCCGPEATVPRDVRPDAPGLCINQIGARCSPGTCCANLVCVALDTGVSVCSVACTQDDPATPLVNEDSCSPLGDQTCVKVASSVGQTACVRRCTPTQGAATCPAGLACRPRSARLAQGQQTALCVYPACTGPTGCPVYLGVTCSPTGPGSCPGAPTGSFCAPVEEGGHGCALPGLCDAKSGLCLPRPSGKNKEVGSSCTEDTTCIGQGFCELERVDASGGVHARNGYCTIEGCSFAKTLPTAACPFGSTCQHLYPGGRCMKTCDLTSAADCRGNSTDKHGDYECYSWSNIAAIPMAVALAPTCEPADAYPCAWPTLLKLPCSALGTGGNPTQMECRDRAAGTYLPPGSPGGVCLDSTSSGP